MQTSQSAGVEPLMEAQHLLWNREVDSAVRRFREAEIQGANISSVAAGLWECWMLKGEFEQAWRESDRIRRIQAYDPHCFWDGRSLENRHLMLRCLHGYGDAVQFLRYLPELRSLARSLTIQVPPAMLSLFRDTEWASWADAVITWNDQEPYWDSQIECMELPYIFRTTLNNIPSALSPLTFPETYEFESPKKRDILHVGLIWNAGEWNPSRSIAISEFQPLTEVGEIAFFNLQGGSAAQDWPLLERYCSIPTEPTPNGISNLAHRISQLDLVISIDTLAAHLSGALGVPVWLLLQHSADWRWMLNRRDSPWYPSMTVFRCGRQEDWGTVIQQVRKQLKDLVLARVA